MIPSDLASAGSGRSLWIGAFVLAIAIHVGPVALAMRPAPELTEAAEDFGGLMVMEFAPDAVALDAEAQEESVSAESEAAPPSPMIEEKAAARQESDLPTAEASPHEAPPDLQLAQQKTLKESEQPPEDGPPTEAMKAEEAAAPSAAAAAASAAAAVPSADVGETSSAPDEGSTTKAVELPRSWQRSVMAHLGRHKRYPVAARSKGVEGEALVHFVMDLSGKVSDVRVTRSSGSPVLDEAAVDLLRRAQPLPVPPASITVSRIELTAPIRYKLR